MGEIKRTKCGVCDEEVDFDTDKPAMLLDPNRKRPNALHICSGKRREKTPVGKCEENLEEFLRTNVIVVAESEQRPNGSGSVKRFKITPGPHNAFFLEFQTDDAAEGLKAYWLPWYESEATTLTLGTGAKFFFTSELTNCRFSVLDPDTKHPTVAHVAGNLSSPSQRTNAATDKGFVATAATGRMRSLSVSDSRDRTNFQTKVKTLALHEYRGQRKGEESSAFVFGIRDKDDKWAFGAQIVKGNMGDVGIIKQTLTQNLEILNYCHRI